MHLSQEIGSERHLRYPTTKMQNFCRKQFVLCQHLRWALSILSEVLFSVGGREESLYIMIFRLIMQYAKAPKMAWHGNWVSFSHFLQVVNLTMGLIGAFGVWAAKNTDRMVRSEVSIKHISYQTVSFLRLLSVQHVLPDRAGISVHDAWALLPLSANF